MPQIKVFFTKRFYLWYFYVRTRCLLALVGGGGWWVGGGVGGGVKLSLSSIVKPMENKWETGENH